MVHRVASTGLLLADNRSCGASQEQLWAPGQPEQRVPGARCHAAHGSRAHQGRAAGPCRPPVRAQTSGQKEMPPPAIVQAATVPTLSRHPTCPGARPPARAPATARAHAGPWGVPRHPAGKRGSVLPLRGGGCGLRSLKCQTTRRSLEIHLSPLPLGRARAGRLWR